MPLRPSFPAPIAERPPVTPTAHRRPTILAVEDSRFASEALRLFSRCLGFRLRRADCLLSAQAHLRTYRPDLLLVDLGLPDGPGEALISSATQMRHRPRAILGMSGREGGAEAALAAGADGFLEKPVASAERFLQVLRLALPDLRVISGGGGREEWALPDRLALSDDLARAADAFGGGPSAMDPSYLSGFLSGVARQSQDDELAEAAAALLADPSDLGGVKALLEARRRALPGAFAPFGAGSAEGKNSPRDARFAC